MNIGLGLDLGSLRSVSSATTEYLGLIATRARAPGTTVSGNKQFRSRSAHKVTDTLKTIRFAYANFYLASGSSKEVGHNATATVESYLEYPAGTFTRMTFSGGNVCNLPAVPVAGATSQVGVVISDALDVTAMNITAASVIFARTLYTSTGGIIYNQVRDSALGDLLQVQAGTTWTSSDLISTITHNAGTAYAPPIAIIGETTKGSLIGLGDSIMFGFHDTDVSDGRTGIVCRGLTADTYAFLNLSSPGARAATILSESPGRSVLFPYCSHMVSNLGINDLISIATLSSAAHIANMTTVAAAFPDRVKKICCTITPDSTDTTDGWTTTGGQTAALGAGDSGVGSRVNYNNAVRGGNVPGYTNYFEIADSVESARDSGKWAPDAAARTITDAAITSGAAVFTSPAQASFTTNDIGVGVRINGAGTAGAALAIDILSRSSATSVTLSGNAATTVSGATAYIGGLTYEGLHPSRKAYTLPAAGGAIDMTKLAYP